MKQLTLLAANVTWTKVEDAMKTFFDSMFWPLIVILAAAATVWGVVIGVKFWRAAGEEQKIKEAKRALVNFIVGIVVIFVIAVVAPLVINALAKWLSDTDTDIEVGMAMLRSGKALVHTLVA